MIASSLPLSKLGYLIQRVPGDLGWFRHANSLTMFIVPRGAGVCGWINHPRMSRCVLIREKSP